MADYRLSQAADADLDEIYDYSCDRFGEAKALAYMESLREILQMLAEHPLSGKDIAHLRQSYRCHHHASHTIYYTIRQPGIFVVRVLHSRMKVLLHL